LLLLRLLTGFALVNQLGDQLVFHFVLMVGALIKFVRQPCHEQYKRNIQHNQRQREGLIFQPLHDCRRNFSALFDRAWVHV